MITMRNHKGIIPFFSFNLVFGFAAVFVSICLLSILCVFILIIKYFRSRDWYNHVTWLNMPQLKLGTIRMIYDDKNDKTARFEKKSI